MVDVHVLLLADSVQPAHPLLEAHKRPRNMPVNHHVSALEIYPFAAGVGGNQHLAVPTEKAALELVSRLVIDGTLEGLDAIADIGEAMREPSCRVRKFSEHQ